MPFNITFHDFTHGQLDKTLKARSDLDVYTKGALEIKNLIVRPGGAVKTRFGTELGFVSEPSTASNNVLIEPNLGTTAGPRGYQMFAFAPSEDLKLLVILGAGNTIVPPHSPFSNRFQYYVEKNDTGSGPLTGDMQTVTMSGSALYNIDCDQVVRVKYRAAQNQRTLVLVTATRPPIVLEWTGADIAVTPLKFRRYPQHDFTRNGYVDSTFGIKTRNWDGTPPPPAPAVPNNATLLKVTPPSATFGGDPTNDYPALIISPLVQTGTGPGESNFRGFYYDGVTPDSHYVGGVIQMAGPIDDPTAPIGYAIIMSTTEAAAGFYPACSNTVCRIRIISPADISWVVTTDGPFTVARPGVKGDQCILTEPAFSSPVLPPNPPNTFPGRGHPRTVTFYESRLCFAGTPPLPQSIFMSQIGQFENFDTGTGDAADAIAYTIASGAEDQIINMTSGRSLQVFTTTNEFSAPVWSEAGLTPQTVTIRRQTSIGSSNCIPVILDNMTMYSKRGGKGVMAFDAINSGGNTYNSQEASVYSTELINNPIHMTSYVESVAFDANLLFVINKPSPDIAGNLILFESLREQNVAAWTTAETDGEYVNVATVGEDVFFMVKRASNPPGANETWTFEKMNWLVCLDGAIKYTTPAPGIQPMVTLPVYMRGKTVDMVGWVGDDVTNVQGVWLGEIAVPASGQVTPTIPVWDPAGGTFDYWIGLKYEQRLQTMPVDIKTQMGSMLFLKKKIFKCYVEYIDSYPFYVNGVEADLRSLAFANGQYQPGYVPGIQLNTAEPPYSGIWMRPTMQKLNLPPTSGAAYRGFVREATVLITTDRPLPMVIQGITAATS